MIGPYTGLTLGEDIKALPKANSAQVNQIASNFVSGIHHPPAVVAAAGFGLGLVALVGL